MIRQIITGIFHAIAGLSLFYGMLQLFWGATFEVRFSASAYPYARLEAGDYMIALYGVMVGIGFIVLAMAIEIILYIEDRMHDRMRQQRANAIWNDVAEIRRVLGITAGMVHKYTKKGE